MKSIDLKHIVYIINLCSGLMIHHIAIAQDLPTEDIAGYDARLEREKDRHSKVPVIVSALDSEEAVNLDAVARQLTTNPAITDQSSLNLNNIVDGDQPAPIELNTQAVVRKNTSQSFVYKDMTSREDSSAVSQHNKCCSSDETINRLLNEMGRKDK